MKINFYKYHGTSNDFIMIDDRSGTANDILFEDIKAICDRRTGIGADGLILLQEHDVCDFKMVYFNADGHEGSMCGNGGRCIVAFAHYLGIIDHVTQFMAIDGLHNAKVVNNEMIELEMIPVRMTTRNDEDYILNTGSPHYVKFCNGVEDMDVYTEGYAIRNSKKYKKEGININFVEEQNDHLVIRTFERGVEDETYSCGTGVVASAISFAQKHDLKGQQLINISTKGGRLSVRFEIEDGYKNIWLIGPATQVFNGTICL